MGFILFISLALGLPAARIPAQLRVTCPVPPVCARCKYDLSASIGAPACPECGLDWFDATTRYQDISTHLRLDYSAAARASAAWLAFVAFTFASPTIAAALIAASYWFDGFRGIDFLKAAQGRELLYAPMLPLNFLICTSSTLCTLPLIAARRKYAYALLVPIAFAADALFWAFIYKG